MLHVILLIIVTPQLLACENKNFVIEASKRSTSNPIFSRSVDSLMQCSRTCQELDNCNFFNFHSHNGTFSCDILSTSNGTENQENVIFAWSFCSQVAPPIRSFSFEKFPQKDLFNDTFVVKTFKIGLEECLEACQNEPQCRGAFFNSATTTCQLSRISLNSVYNPRSFLKASKYVDLYENNDVAYQMSPNSCTFMRVAGGGLLNLSDQVLRNVETATVCEEYCTLRTFTSDPCRSYTYDASGKNCYLEHSSSRMNGKSPLQHLDENLSHGDLEDCVEFSLKCKESSLEVLATSFRMFQGTMKTKMNKKSVCEEKFNGDYDFGAKFDFNKCGLKEVKGPEPSFKGVVHIKEGSTNLITVRDKVLQVNCRMHSFAPLDQLISVSMSVNARNDTVMSDGVVFKPKPIEKNKYSLKILSMNEEELKNVHIGENGWIKISVEVEKAKMHGGIDPAFFNWIGKDTKYDIKDSGNFAVTSLSARDVKSGKRILLIDDDGCVIRKDIVRAIRKDSLQSTMFQINFSGFEKQTEVVYHATAESCSIGCIPKCNSELILPSKTNLSRSKRASEVRQLELTTDVYQVQGSRITLLNRPKSLLRFYKSDKNKEPVSDEENGVFVLKKTPTILTSLHSCVIDDMTCLFTIVLASIQLFLLVSCVMIMFCYCQQWRLYRDERNSLSAHSVEYQLSDSSTTLSQEKTSPETSSTQ